MVARLKLEVVLFVYSHFTHITTMATRKPKGAYGNKNATRYLKLSQEERESLKRTALEHTVDYIDEHGLKHVFSTRSALINGEVAQIQKNGAQYLVTHAAALGWPASRVRLPKKRILSKRKRAILEGWAKDRPVNWFDTLSHTCGIPFCLSHYCWEEPWWNSHRDGCHKYRCFVRCKHSPRCLRQASLGRAREFLDANLKKNKPKTKAQIKKAKQNQANYAANQDARQAASRTAQRVKRGTLVKNQRIKD